MKTRLVDKLDPIYRFAGEKFKLKDAKSGPYTKTDRRRQAFYSCSKRIRAGYGEETLPTPMWIYSDDITTKSGVYNPGWSQRVKSGKYVGSQYWFDRTWYARTKLLFAHNYRWRGYFNGNPYWYTDKYWYDGYIGGFMSEDLDVEPPWTSGSVIWDLDQKAKLSIARKTKEAYQKITGMVFLGELRETLNMIRRPAYALRQALSKHLSKTKSLARRSRTRKELQLAVNQTYLEFTFGALPLISDVKAGAVAFAEVLNRRDAGLRPIRSKRFGFEEKKVQFHGPVGVPWYVGTSLPAVCTRYTEEKIEVSYWTMQDYRLSRWERDSSWATTFGISLNEFVPTVWELIPYSFVVDYFTNIGDILNFESTDWSRLVGSFYQVKHESSRNTRLIMEHEKMGTSAAPSISNWTDSGPAISARKRISFSRTNVDLTSEHLDFESSLLVKARQALNLGALAIQRKEVQAAVTEAFHKLK